MTRRARFHDYRRPGWYLITMVTKDRRNILGDLVFDPTPHIRLLPFGQEVMDVEKNKITKYYPNVHVNNICLMPDHIHMILWVSHPFTDHKTLGDVISGFKQGCNRCLRQITRVWEATAFERGFNDRVLLEDGQLARWKAYLRDNPRRLAEVKRHPDLFQKLQDCMIADRKCQIVGNRYLLDVPDIEAVVVHRADDDDTYQANVKRWMACGERGGVLISAAIAKRERDVMHMALKQGYQVIWLRNNGFAPLYKPSGRTFDACVSGQLLEISPYEYDPTRKDITRAQCLYLNKLAMAIAANSQQMPPTTA